MKKKVMAIIMAAAMLLTMASMTTMVSASEKYYFNFNFDNYQEAPWQFNVGDWGNGLTKSIVVDSDTSSKTMKLSSGSTGFDYMYIATSNSGMSNSSAAQGLELNFDIKYVSSPYIAVQYRHTNSEGVDSTGRHPLLTDSGTAKVAYDKTGGQWQKNIWYNVNIKTDCTTGTSHTIVKAADGTVLLDGTTAGEASNNMLTYGLPLAMLRWQFHGENKEIYLDNMYLKEIDPGKVYEQTLVFDDFQDVDLSAATPTSKWDLSAKSANVTPGYEKFGDNIMAKLAMAGTGGWTYTQPKRIWGANNAKCYKFGLDFKYNNDNIPSITFQIAESGGYSDGDYFAAATMNFVADTIKVGSTTEEFTFVKDTLYKLNLYYVPATGYVRAEVTDGVKSAMAVGTIATKSTVIAARLSLAASIGTEEWDVWFDNFGVYSVAAGEAAFECSYNNLAFDKQVLEEGTITASVDVTSNACFENYVSGAKEWLIVASYKENRISDITLVSINPSNGKCEASVNVAADDTRVAAYVWKKANLVSLGMVEITE